MADEIDLVSVGSGGVCANAHVTSLRGALTRFRYLTVTAHPVTPPLLSGARVTFPFTCISREF